MMQDCWVIHNRGMLPTHPDRYCARRWIDGHLDPWNILSAASVDSLRDMLEFAGCAVVDSSPPPGYGDHAMEWWLWPE